MIRSPGQQAALERGIREAASLLQQVGRDAEGCAQSLALGEGKALAPGLLARDPLGRNAGGRGERLDAEAQRDAEAPQRLLAHLDGLPGDLDGSLLVHGGEDSTAELRGNLPIRTPGTALAFHDLRSWIVAAIELDARRCSSLRYRQIEAHWQALPLDMVKLSDDRPALERLLALIGLGNVAWSKPGRGDRGGTKWERVNMAARNRLWQLARAEDLPMTGHNSSRGRMAA
ncbi:MAG TPA: hypothetical protein VHG92_02855 [Afifellaceae bacterium]|nr:hypothetical protein [Afifellaceae bacterium]